MGVVIAFHIFELSRKYKKILDMFVLVSSLIWNTMNPSWGMALPIIPSHFNEVLPERQHPIRIPAFVGQQSPS